MTRSTICAACLCPTPLCCCGGRVVGPVLIMDERGVYPSSLDAAVEEQRAYFAKAQARRSD